jgi:SAM-dependent methyltransferase
MARHPNSRRRTSSTTRTRRRTPVAKLRSAAPNGSAGTTASTRGDAAARRLHREDVERNRQAWNEWAPDYFQVALDYWLAEEPVWGIWATPEAQLGLLAGVEEGTDAIELGCGTAHVCAWLAQRGAIPVGVDISDEQLDSARMFQRQFEQPFPLVRTSADDVPFDDQSFDFAISEYGASTWLDPYWWVPEAARLLRPGGRLVFVVSGAIMMACTPADGPEATSVLERDYFGMHRFEVPGESFVEFHLAHGDWIRVLRDNGFDVEDLIEVQPSDDASTRFRFVSAEWARRWPSEEIWIARRRS